MVAGTHVLGISFTVSKCILGGYIRRRGFLLPNMPLFVVVLFCFNYLFTYWKDSYAEKELCSPLVPFQVAMVARAGPGRSRGQGPKRLDCPLLSSQATSREMDWLEQLRLKLRRPALQEVA